MIYGICVIYMIIKI